MSIDFRAIMSGERKGLLASLMRTGLSIGSVPYRIAIARRNRSYDTGRSEIHRCGVPVISVGNLTTGGTGKTPVVCFLAKWFRAQGIRVAIVSRGYGRGENDANDEALELHARLPDVPHVQDADRVEAARIAVEELETELILMDDGFQHRRLHRDLDVVVIDATEPFGFGHLLPRGLLREPIVSLRRADIVILSRCDSVSDQAIQRIEQRVQQANARVPIVHSSHTPTRLLEYPNREMPIDSLRGRNIAVVSAIGNPAAFAETLRGCGANLVDSRTLPDHDAYSPDTVQAIRQWARSLGDAVSMIVCTHKDLVKLCTDNLGGVPVAALLIELRLLSDPAPWESRLKPFATKKA
ncbi:tetraacyldisaccharide 4'-kinase [Novipirellula artificiosorum]|uniref:Tetraacyldisaccharide 4'-kinase n=1 Tax=Novipirellula artificiosorum TaxID=2528016 RepID=A0A5C6E557_9BACT|nr:tetraacyldisaccharide 4'-kinase [Novipirellula artificiosorum]TWU42721.1 Tetraacyldisaccharide 4'-kinase [Novipirellula artificiosorum]